MFGELHTLCTFKEDLSLCRFRKRIDELQSIKRLHFRPYKTIHVFQFSQKMTLWLYAPSTILHLCIVFFFVYPVQVSVQSKGSERSCICVLEIMYLCVRDHVFVCQRSRICVLAVMYLCQRSCICVLEVMYLCVRGHVFVCQRSYICVLAVTYLCVRGHVFVCQRSCICVLEVMFLCVGVSI